MMVVKVILRLLFFASCSALLEGCATGSKPRLDAQFGESVVFVGEEAAALAHFPVSGQPFYVRNGYVREQSIQYAEGLDFVVDYAHGAVRRTPGSRLPDFRKNVLFGHENFDHSKFPGFGNGGFFAFIDYSFAAVTNWPVQESQTDLIAVTQAKLKAGQGIRVVAFGDSITAGGEASKPELIFWNRWAEDLRRKYPGVSVTAINGATCGDTTVQGLHRLQTRVLDEKPDLVLIGFGMNDHNVNSVPIPQFEQNLKEMIARIRGNTQTEVILFSAFPPNPKWKFGSHHMADYAAATERVARDNHCAYADVFSNWQIIADRKKPEDLLGNNINHPNDFGHWIYFRVFQALGL